MAQIVLASNALKTLRSIICPYKNQMFDIKIMSDSIKNQTAFISMMNKISRGLLNDLIMIIYKFFKNDYEIYKYERSGGPVRELTLLRTYIGYDIEYFYDYDNDTKDQVLVFHMTCFTKHIAVGNITKASIYIWSGYTFDQLQIQKKLIDLYFSNKFDTIHDYMCDDSLHAVLLYKYIFKMTKPNLALLQDLLEQKMSLTTLKEVMTNLSDQNEKDYVVILTCYYNTSTNSDSAHINFVESCVFHEIMISCHKILRLFDCIRYS